MSSEITNNQEVQQNQETGQKSAKKIGYSTIFLWSVYILTLILIILVVSENLEILMH